MKEEFRKELEQLINKHSMESGSNTPDYILADYLCACLLAFNATVSVRGEWFGRVPEFKGIAVGPNPVIVSN